MLLKTEKKRFLLISIIPQNMTDEEALIGLVELKLLVEAMGGIVVDLVIQQRELRDKGMYIGKGKIEEAADIVWREKIDIVVLNSVVKSTHLHELKNIFEKNRSGIMVWDRVDLILQIFSQHAKTAESKLQIELAAMRHMGPRIYGMGYVLSRQGGGIGTLGVGETNTELMKRHWREQIKKTKDKLVKLSEDRVHALERRKRIGLTTVSLIGYTNAGKTALFNQLSGKNKLSENALFATLESAVGKLYLPNKQKEILITDTIGFIHDLPARLIEAFKSTLLESINADLLIHVIDSADKSWERKVRVVDQVLFELGISGKKRILVFGKCDLLSVSERDQIVHNNFGISGIFVSATTKEGIKALVSLIEKEL